MLEIVSLMKFSPEIPEVQSQIAFKLQNPNSSAKKWLAWMNGFTLKTQIPERNSLQKYGVLVVFLLGMN